MKSLLRTFSPTLRFIAILTLAISVRWYQLESLPVILNRDEAALGYNAVLLRHLGVDEWGQPWPLMLQSFGDFKLVGYVNSVVVSQLFFGETDWAVRFPSAVAGVLLVVVAGWWGKQWRLSHLTAFLVAVTPVFWFYSRIAFEANLALTLFATGLGSLLLPKKQHWSWQAIGVGFLWWSTLVYNTPLLLLPSIILMFPFKYGVRHWKKWWGVVAALLLVTVGMFLQLIPLTQQKSSITIFSDQLTWTRYGEYREAYSGLTQKVWGNKYVFFSQVVVRNTLAALSPKFMVTEGGQHPWHALPHHGHLYGLVYLLGWAGIVVVLYDAKRGQFTHLWLLWLTAMSLMPASITVDAPHATRSLFFFWCWTMLAVLGIDRLTHQKNWRFMMLVVTSVLVFFSASKYGFDYFNAYPSQQSESLKFGLPAALEILDRDRPGQAVAVVDEGGYDYIVFAWYSHLDPSYFMSTVSHQLPNYIGLRYGERVGRFHFIGRPEDANPQQERVLMRWSDVSKQWLITDTP